MAGRELLHEDGIPPAPKNVDLAARSVHSVGQNGEVDFGSRKQIVGLELHDGHSRTPLSAVRFAVVGLVDGRWLPD